MGMGGVRRRGMGVGGGKGRGMGVGGEGKRGEKGKKLMLMGMEMWDRERKRIDRERRIDNEGRGEE